jgi:hypothetical protein
MKKIETEFQSKTEENQPNENRIKNNNFYILRQDGFMKTNETVTLGLGSLTPGEWKKIGGTERAKIKSVRAELIQLLDLDSMNKLPQLLNDPRARERAGKKAYKKIGKMFGIEGRDEEVETAIKGYGKLANQVILGVVKDYLSDSEADFGITNGVQTVNEPVELGLMMLDDTYSQRQRFEAKRKLSLMLLAGLIDERERERNINEQSQQFNNFLDEHVWSGKRKKGETVRVYLLSTHDPKDFRVIGKPEVHYDRENLKTKKGQKITPLSQREFEINGRTVQIHTSIREKGPEAKILKLLKKGEENPAVAVDDELGFMGVANTARDVEAFKERLRQGAKNANSMIIFEGVEDNLSGGKRGTPSVGGSKDVQMFKSFVRVNGLRCEMILHTNETYLNYKYKSGIAHEEYEITRLYDNGIISLLFPPEIYKYNHERMKKTLEEKVKQNIRSTS